MHKIKKVIVLLALSVSLTFISVEATAQCPMCKMSAEQNLKMGGTAGKGLNRGILMMLAMPYAIVGGLGYYWLRNRRKEGEIELDDNPQNVL